MAKSNSAGSDRPISVRIEATQSISSVLHALLDEAQQRSHDQRCPLVATQVIGGLFAAALARSVGRAAFTWIGSRSEVASPSQIADLQVAQVAVRFSSRPRQVNILACRDDLAHGLQPILVSRQTEIARCQRFLYAEPLGASIEVFAIEAFLISHLFKSCKFKSDRLVIELRDLILHYNEISSENAQRPTPAIEIIQYQGPGCS